MNLDLDYQNKYLYATCVALSIPWLGWAIRSACSYISERRKNPENQRNDSDNLAKLVEDATRKRPL